MKLYPILLKPYVSETIWGGRKLIEEYGVETEKKNAAEGWMLSAHEAGTSIIANGELCGMTLAQAIKVHPYICGKNADNFDDFPILIKFIDARDDLSVQVHPTKEYCLKTGKGQSKTECWYIIDCDPDAYLLLGFEKEISKEIFRKAIENNTLIDYVSKVKVKKGDFFFIESGTLHAICKGILLAEVQESSNTTYRIYDYGRLGNDGKPRDLHVSDAVEVTKTEPYKISEYCKGFKLYNAAKKPLADCPLFKVWKLDINGEHSDSANDDSFVSLLVLDGECTLDCCTEKINIKKGDSIMIPAGSGKYRLTGNAELIETRI